MGTALKLASSDAISGSFPSYDDWAIEMYFKLPGKPTTGYVDIVTDGGDDFWIRLNATGSTILVEAVCRQGIAFDPFDYGDLLTLSGSVPNDNCWHQLVFQADLVDANLGFLYLDGVEADFNGEYVPYDFTGGAWPGFLRWGAFTGTSGMIVDLTHIALYDSGPE